MDSIAVELSKDTTTQELLNTLKNLTDDTSSWHLVTASCAIQINERQCFDAIMLRKMLME